MGGSTTHCYSVDARCDVRDSGGIDDAWSGFGGPISFGGFVLLHRHTHHW